MGILSKIGQLKIMELRDKSKEALGDDFDIKDFHDHILSFGSIPLNILEEKVDELFPPEETKTIDELWLKTYGLRCFYESIRRWAEEKIPEEIKPLVEKCTELKEVKTND